MIFFTTLNFYGFYVVHASFTDLFFLVKDVFDFFV